MLFVRWKFAELHANKHTDTERGSERETWPERTGQSQLPRIENEREGHRENMLSCEHKVVTLELIIKMSVSYVVLCCVCASQLMTVKCLCVCVSLSLALSLSSQVIFLTEEYWWLCSAVFIAPAPCSFLFLSLLCWLALQNHAEICCNCISIYSFVVVVVVVVRGCFFFFRFILILSQKKKRKKNRQCQWK